MIDNKKYNIFVIVALIFLFLFVGFLTLDKDLPNNYSSSRAPYLDESLKNYIVKNIVEHNIPQPYNVNEFRSKWLKSPIYSFWVLPFAKLIGIGYYQVRLISLFTAVVALGIIFLIIKSSFSYYHSFIFFLLLVSNSSFFFFSRLGTYESLFLLITCIVIYLILFKNKNFVFLLTTGFICSLLYLLKAIGIIIFIFCLFYLLLNEYYKKNRIVLKNFKNTILLFFSFSFFQIFISFLMKIFFYEAPRSYSFEGSKAIVGNYLPSNIIQLLYNILITFQETEFFISNSLLVALALFGLGFIFLFGKNLYKNDIDVIMVLWFIVGTFTMAVFTYRPSRFYYFLIPSIIYWATFILKVQKTDTYPLKLSIIYKTLGSVFFAFSFKIIIDQIILKFDNFIFTDINLAHLVYTNNIIKYVLIFILIFGFFDKLISILKNHLNFIKSVFQLCFIILLFTNLLILFKWTFSDNVTMRMNNDKIRTLVESSNNFKFAGQWSPAFVFDLPKVQSFPIIPGVYNEHIIEELDIKYLFLERYFIDQKIKEKIINDKKYDISVIDSFLIAEKYHVDLYELKNNK